MNEKSDAIVAKSDSLSKQVARERKDNLVAKDIVERIREFRRNIKLLSHEEFWEIMREGRQHSCDKYYEDKWDREDKEQQSGEALL